MSRDTAPAKAKIPGRDPISQLYRAIDRYVSSRGGSILVIGGIQVQQWDSQHTFMLAVKCTGRKPILNRQATKTQAMAQ